MVILNTIHFKISLFLFFSIIINLLPFPDIINSCRPPILLLVLIYWSLAYPNKINLTYAFITGIIMDILLVTPLGFYALTHVITIYLITIYYPQIRLQSNINKMFSLLIILIPYIFMSTVLNDILEIQYNILNIIFSVIISVIIWPVLFHFLRIFRQKYV